MGRLACEKSLGLQWANLWWAIWFEEYSGIEARQDDTDYYLCSDAGTQFVVTEAADKLIRLRTENLY
jgi:hypothetical protein